MGLYHLSIVVRPSKEALAATITTEQAAPVNRRPLQLFLRPGEELTHVFGCGLGRTPLELDGLAWSGQSADGNAA